MKQDKREELAEINASRFPRSAWIETIIYWIYGVRLESRFPRSAWIETQETQNHRLSLESRFPRSAWIETIDSMPEISREQVALPPERVD